MIPFSNVFFRIFWNNVKTSCQPKILQINTNNTLCLGHFPFNKYSSLKFRKFYGPSETDTPVLQTRPKPPHGIWLLSCHFVTRIQKNRSGNNKFVKWKGTSQSNKLDDTKVYPNGVGQSLIWFTLVCATEQGGVLGGLKSWQSIQFQYFRIHGVVWYHMFFLNSSPIMLVFRK